MLRTAIASLLASALIAPAVAQPQRNFPQTALRGTILIGQAPEILLNGLPGRLAPGARIRDANNMAVVPAGLLGGRYLVHYTIDPSGLVKEVWILTPAEAGKRPWPTKPQEAATWSFDPVAQAWYKP